MGNYGITGWSGGGRRPINYGLHAGQFRTTKYNVPHNTTIINNNIFGGGFVDTRYRFDYARPSFMCEQNTTPKWMNWMMGTGFGLSMLGGIMSLFSGKEAEQGGTETVQPQPSTDEFAGLKERFPGGTFIKISSDKYCAEIGGKNYDGESITDLYENIINDIEAGKKPDPNPEGDPVQQGDVQGSGQQHTDPPETDHDYIAEFYEHLGETDPNYKVVNMNDENFNLSKCLMELAKVVDNGEGPNGQGIKDINVQSVTMEDGSQITENSQITTGTVIKINGKRYEVNINNDGYVFLEAKETTGGDKNTQIYILDTYNEEPRISQHTGLGDLTKGAASDAYYTVGGGATSGSQQTQSTTTYSTNSVSETTETPPSRAEIVADFNATYFAPNFDGTVKIKGVDRDAITYRSDNAIYEDLQSKSGLSFFADAIFRINGEDYNLTRTRKSDVKYSDVDTLFEEASGKLSLKTKYGSSSPLLGAKFNGKGKLNGAEIVKYEDTLCVRVTDPKTNEYTYYDLNLLMSSNQYVEV